MALIEVTAVLHRPVDEVFHFVADQTNAPSWQQGLVRVQKITDGPVGVGTRYTFERKVMGRTQAASNLYVDYQPGRTVGFRSTSGPLQFHAAYVTSRVAGGTELTCRMDLQDGHGLLGLLMPLVARRIQKEMRANFTTLKTLLDHR